MEGTCSALTGCQTVVMNDHARHAQARVDPNDTTSSFARNGGCWSEVTALEPQAEAHTHRIRLGGLLRASWMLGVCNGLAQRGVSIDRAHARRLAHDGTWIAELHVVAPPEAADPLHYPLIAFAEAEPSEPAGPLALREYQLIESTDHAGTLRLTFRARDSVGLLGSLLAAFASLSLLPVEMHIETSEAEARDTLWLTSAGKGSPRTPNEVDRRALDALLKRAVHS
jgi:hypothetical protein